MAVADCQSKLKCEVNEASHTAWLSKGRQKPEAKPYGDDRFQQVLLLIQKQQLTVEPVILNGLDIKKGISH